MNGLTHRHLRGSRLRLANNDFLEEERWALVLMWMDRAVGKGRPRGKGPGQMDQAGRKPRQLIMPTEPSELNGEWRGEGLPPTATPPPAGQPQ